MKTSSPPTVCALCAVCLLGGAAALGQSFNIDFGAAAGAPPASFGGVGQPGVWNTLDAVHGGTYPLVDLNGGPTPVTVRNLGGTANILANDPGTSGDDAALMDDYLATFSLTVETCLFFSNLENGTYEVITYAWAPTLPTIVSEVRVDDADQPQTPVGGAWPGGQVEGVTYAVHTIEVSDGHLNMHSVRTVAGGDRAALNGVQLRRVTPCPADLDGSGAIELTEVSILLSHYGGAGGAEDGDLDGDGDVDLTDLSLMLGVFGTSC